MKKFLNRFSTEEKVSIILKTLAISVLAMLMLGCKSLDFRLGTMQVQSRYQQPVEIQTTIIKTTHQAFSELDPWDLGLSFGGNWIHCRHHGFHDLNDWTDFSYSPYFCRPSHGFLSGSRWNSNWGGMNHWNNNWMWNPRNQYQYWGSNWSPWMGNAHYGYYGNYGYYGWNNNYVPYQWRRSNINSRRNSFSPRTRSTRTNTPTRVIRTTPTRTRTLPNNVRPTRTIRTPRTTPNTVRPVRTRITPNTVRPTRTTPNTVRPVRTQPVRINSPRINAPSRTSGNTNVIRRSQPSRNNSQSKRRQ
ncbi:hypothetical protein OAE73_00860 [bacterium]|nr:hypothetical protein [bacterium]